MATAASVDVGEGAPSLKKGALPLWSVVFQSITYMAPATGIAFAIGIAIPQSGTTLPLSVLIALFGCLFTAVAIGQLAKHVPSAGGIYTYVANGLNTTFGVYVGWLYFGLAAFVPVFMFALNGFVIDNTLKSEGVWAGSPGWWFWTLITIGVVFCLTYFDVKFSGRAGIVLGTFEIAIFLALGAWMIINGSNSISAFNPAEAQLGAKGLFIGAIYGVLAFIGFEAASTLGEEAANPRRSVPRAVFYSCLGVGLYYVFTSYAWVAGTNFNILPYYEAHSGNPWSALAHQYWHSGWILVFLAIVNSCVGCASAAVNQTSRVLFSMGRAGVAPKFLGYIHPKHRTPSRGVVTAIAMSTAITFLSVWKFGDEIAYGVVGTAFTVWAIVVYLFACAACMGYFYQGAGRPHRNAFLHIVCPIMGIIIFTIALYATYFSFDNLFEYVGEYPYDWALVGALIFLAAGIFFTLYMRLKRPHQMAATTRAFGGEHSAGDAIEPDPVGSAA